MPTYREYFEEGPDETFISPNRMFRGSEPISRKKEQQLERFVDKRNLKRDKNVPKRNNNKYK